jgi:hypothetical protein
LIKIESLGAFAENIFEKIFLFALLTLNHIQALCSLRNRRQRRNERRRSRAGLPVSSVCRSRRQTTPPAGPTQEKRPPMSTKWKIISGWGGASRRGGVTSHLIIKTADFRNFLDFCRCFLHETDATHEQRLPPHEVTLVEDALDHKFYNVTFPGVQRGQKG